MYQIIKHVSSFLCNKSKIRIITRTVWYYFVLRHRLSWIKRYHIKPIQNISYVRDMICTYMRIWRWKSHWKVQPHWPTTETTLKSFIKDSHTEMFSLITVRLMLIPYNPTENIQRYSGFQCDFQCHIHVVKTHTPNHVSLSFPALFNTNFWVSKNRKL